mmetsp:Transcript_52253/g.122556  ORF Transcript_52253/g.122556 Transcript_52253/m.122556 type:complete len:204 (+) Transcript_52253:395-1006(+)
MPLDLCLVDGADIDATRHRLHELVVVLHQLHHVRVLALEIAQRLPRQVIFSPAHLLDLVRHLLASHRPPMDGVDVAFFAPKHLLFLGELHRAHLRQLLVSPLEETVLDVGDRGQSEVGFKMVHRMLRNVRHPKVVMLPHVPNFVIALFELADKELEERCLARAVGSEKSDARGHRQLAVHILQHVALAARVSEGDVGELHDRL